MARDGLNVGIDVQPRKSRLTGRLVPSELANCMESQVGSATRLRDSNTIVNRWANSEMSGLRIFARTVADEVFHA